MKKTNDITTTATFQNMFTYRAKKLFGDKKYNQLTKEERQQYKALKEEIKATIESQLATADEQTAETADEQTAETADEQTAETADEQTATNKLDCSFTNSDSRAELKEEIAHRLSIVFNEVRRANNFRYTVNVDYKKPKITVKNNNKLVARINIRAKSYYLRTYKDKKETIIKDASLEQIATACK